MIESEEIIQKIKDNRTYKQELDAENKYSFEETIFKLLDEDYMNIPIISSTLSSLFMEHPKPNDYIQIVYEILETEYRYLVYDFVCGFLLVNQDIKKQMYEFLSTSYKYKHRLALAELIKMFGVRSKEDKETVLFLIYDSISVVVLNAVRCVDANNFTESEIFDVVNKLNEDGSFVYQGATPYLLSLVKYGFGDDAESIKKYEYIEKLSKNDSWIVRLNLCYNLKNIIQNVNNLNFLTNCFEVLVNDNFEEICESLCENIKYLKDDDLQYRFYGILLKNNSEKVKLKCLNELDIKAEMETEKSKIDFILCLIQNLVKNQSLQIKFKVIEIFSKNMAKLFQSNENDDNSELEILKINTNENNKEILFLSNNNTYKDKNTCSNCGKLDRFNFIPENLTVLLENKNWRIKNKTLEIIESLCQSGKDYFNEHLKIHYLKLLQDQNHEVRYNAAILFGKLVKRFGMEILTDFKNELENIVKEKNYSIRINIVDLINELDDIDQDNFSKNILPLIEIIGKDPVKNIKLYLAKMLEKYKQKGFYNDKILPIIQNIMSIEE